ncbi:MAG: septum formation family protein [Actinomycetaceae bacterium]
MQRTTFTARRKMALVAALPFLALGLGACSDDEPIAPPTGGGTVEPDGGDTDTDTDTDTGGDTESDDTGTDTDTDSESDDAGTDGDTGGDSGASLDEFDNGEGAPGVFTANPGECIDSVDSSTMISCDDPHDREVFYTYNIDDTEFPGEEAIQEEVRTECSAQFEAYVGAPYESSSFEISSMYPSEATFSQAGDTEVICLLDSAEPVTGSAFQSGM